MAYGLGGLALAEDPQQERGGPPRPLRHWCLTTRRDRPIKIGAKLVRHGRYVILQLAEVAVPQELFRQILQRLRRLGLMPETG